tara:strand:+ start:154 stop:552 length:399 start_codon:yes stop_codon:yes gene_type:complete
MITNVKVYYEDTDASGRVYYSNYLKYLERGRTDFLSSLGFSHKEFYNNNKIYFVVKTCNIEYVKPANFEDILEIKTSIVSFSKAKIEFNQQILRDDQLIVDSNIIIVSINNENKISKMPNEMLEILAQHQIK